jgi:hypothetical protein
MSALGCHLSMTCLCCLGALEAYELPQFPDLKPFYSSYLGVGGWGGVGASVSWHYKSLTKKCGPLNSRSVGDQIALSTFYFLSNIHSQRRDMFSLKPGKDFSID